MVKNPEHVLSPETERWDIHDEEILARQFHALQKKLEVGRKYRETNWKRWIESLKNQKECRVPKPEVVYKGRCRLIQLPKDDPRGLFAGEYVNCCQHPQGFGYPCAWHGHESPNGAFWVVEEEDEVFVAVAWVWRYGNALVIDSVEMKKEIAESCLKPILHSMYQKAAQSVLGKKDIIRVYAGVGFSSTWYTGRSQKRPFPNPALYQYKTPDGDYRIGDDSKEVHIVAQLNK